MQLPTMFPFCLLQSEYHYEYTACDSSGSRWRVAVPHTPGLCTGLPDPVRGTECCEILTRNGMGSGWGVGMAGMGNEVEGRETAGRQAKPLLAPVQAATGGWNGIRGMGIPLGWDGIPGMGCSRDHIHTDSLGWDERD